LGVKTWGERCFSAKIGASRKRENTRGGIVNEVAKKGF